MLKTLLSKITTGLAILSGILLLMLKGERRARKKAEHENEVNDKIKDIHEKQLIDKQEVLADEPENIKQKVQVNAGKSRRDRASRL